MSSEIIFAKILHAVTINLCIRTIGVAFIDTIPLEAKIVSIFFLLRQGTRRSDNQPFPVEKPAVCL